MQTIEPVVLHYNNGIWEAKCHFKLDSGKDCQFVGVGDNPVSALITLDREIRQYREDNTV